MSVPQGMAEIQQAPDRPLLGGIPLDDVDLAFRGLAPTTTGARPAGIAGQELFQSGSSSEFEEVGVIEQ